MRSCCWRSRWDLGRRRTVFRKCGGWCGLGTNEDAEKVRLGADGGEMKFTAAEELWNGLLGPQGDEIEVSRAPGGNDALRPVRIDNSIATEEGGDDGQSEADGSSLRDTERTFD